MLRDGMGQWWKSLSSPPHPAPYLFISAQELGAFLAAGLHSTCSHSLKASQQKCPQSAIAPSAFRDTVLNQFLILSVFADFMFK